MAKRIVSLRLADDLVEWLDGQPGSRTEVVERCVEHVRDSPEVGVLGARPAVLGRGVRVDSVPAAVRWARERQAKLNREKGL
jgi:hypothetical protein